MIFDFIWLLKTPGGEFICKDEPQGYDWAYCSKKLFIRTEATSEIEEHCFSDPNFSKQLRDHVDKISSKEPS